MAQHTRNHRSDLPTHQRPRRHLAEDCEYLPQMSHPPNCLHRNGTPMRMLTESQELFVRGGVWQKTAGGFSFSDLLATLGVLSLLFFLLISAFALINVHLLFPVCVVY